MHCWRWTLVLGSTLAWSLPAHADVANERSELPLDYTAPAGCAVRSAFVEAVHARVHHAADGHYKLTVVVTRRDRFYGKLVSEDDQGHVSSREISAATCADVVSALALAAALSLEQEDDAPATIAPAHEPPPPPPDPPPPAVDATQAAPRPQRTLDDVAAAAGVGTVGTVAYAPSVAGGAAVFAEAQSRYASFRLGAAFALTPPLDQGASAGKVSYVWGVARADVCPRGIDRGDFTVTACARVELGSLQAHVFGSSDEDTHPWLAAGLAARLRYLTGTSLFLELEPWTVVSMLSQRDVLPPGVTVHDGGPIAGGLTLSVGTLFFK